MSNQPTNPRRLQYKVAFMLICVTLLGMAIASSLKSPVKKDDEHSKVAFSHPIDVPPAPSLSLEEKAASEVGPTVSKNQSVAEVIKKQTQLEAEQLAQVNEKKELVQPVWVKPEPKVADAYLPKKSNEPTETNQQNESPEELEPLQTPPVDKTLAAVPAKRKDDLELDVPKFRSAAIPKMKEFRPLPTDDKSESQSPQIISEKVEIPEMPIREWAKSPRLAELIEPLTEIESTRKWSTGLKEELNELYGVPHLADDQAATLLEELKGSIKEATEISNKLGYTWERTKLTQASFALSRRLKIWTAAHQIAKQGNYSAETMADPNAMQPTLETLKTFLEEGGQLASWNDYLMLDQVSYAISDEVTQENRRDLAKLVIGRMNSSNLNAAQKELMQIDEFKAFNKELQVWTAGFVPLPAVISQLETYEISLDSYSANQLGSSIKSLLASSSEDVNKLGQVMDHSYRNANVRFAASRSFMNALMPKMEPEDSDVNDYVLGNLVRGRSRTSTVLQVSTIQDPHQWRIQLDAMGTVDSNTSSYAGPVTIFNRGRSQYRAAKQLVVNQNGFFVSKAVANAQTATDIADLQTEYDSIPLIGSVVRNVAMSQTESKKYDAEREVQYKVKRKAELELDRGLNEKVEQWQNQLLEKVVNPLRKLEINPEPIELRTATSHIVGRFRVTGDSQLGAHAPRPVAAPGSVFTMQVHESTLNNLLEKLNLSGRRATVDQWLAESEVLLKGVDEELLADIPEGVELEFAEIDPVRIRLVDNQALLTLRIAELKSGRTSWKNFAVRAAFELDGDQLNAKFSRQGSVQLKGKKLRFRDQIALRTVFSKILSKNLHLPLLPEQVVSDERLQGFEASQLTIHEGWFAVSIRPKKTSSTRVSSVPHVQQLVAE